MSVMPIEPSDEEEKYFHEVEIEARRRLREHLEDNARKLEEAAKVAEHLATDDHGLAEEIRALGFAGDNAKIFDLLPLVHVAWADGKIQRSERAAILKLLEQRNLARDSQPFQTMEALLEERPTDAFMRESLSLLQRVVAKQGGRADEIVELCMHVAAASGGLLGLGSRIDEAERKRIREIAEQLGPAANTAVTSQLE